MMKLSFIALSLVICHFAHAAAAEDKPWTLYWANAMELSKNPDTAALAIPVYTKAINALNSVNQISSHLYLLNERGNLYLKVRDVNGALQDFSFVINQPQAKREEVADALWGRIQANLMVGNAQAFAIDCKQLKQLEVYLTPYEETDQYFIFKMGPRMQNDKRLQDTFVRTLLQRNSIKLEKDVIFSPSGMGIVKKRKENESLMGLFSK